MGDQGAGRRTGHDAEHHAGPDGAKRSRARTRRRLIAAGCDVLAQQGLRGASVAQLCAAAGFTRGAFYSNFSSKEELAIAIYEDHVDQLVEVLAEQVRLRLEAAQPVDEVLAYALDAISGVSGDGSWHAFRLEMQLAAGRDPRLRQVVDAQYERLVAAATRSLMEAQKRGVALQLPAETLARLLVAVRDGELMRSAVGGRGARTGLLPAAWQAFVREPERGVRPGI